jgi:hypothetical protein
MEWILFGLTPTVANKHRTIDFLLFTSQFRNAAVSEPVKIQVPNTKPLRTTKVWCSNILWCLKIGPWSFLQFFLFPFSFLIGYSGALLNAEPDA